MLEESIPWSYRELRKSLFVIFLLIFALNGVLLFVGFGEIFEKTQYKAVFSLLLFLAQEVIFLLPLFFFLYRRHRISKEMLGFRSIGLWETIKFTLVGYFYIIALGFFFFVVTGGAGSDIPGFQIQETYFPLFGDIGKPLNLILAIIVLVVIAPIVEEVVFRGTVLQTLIKHFGTGFGNILTALFFAFIHFQFESFFLLFFLSFILNWIFLKAKSLYPCIGFHMLNNGIAFLAHFLIYTRP